MGETKTQKAKGIKALALHEPALFTAEMVKQAKVFPHDPLQPFPFFARPCPLEPRHGFVESRVINTAQEWDALIKEIDASNEPHFEVIQMPFIHCQFSGVMTEHGISYGPGNDGVTGGQSARMIPATCPTRTALFNTFNLNNAAAGAGITKSPYLEFVEYNGNLEAVQLRNGPELALANKYIPKKMTVLKIVSPTDLEAKHLLEWEKRMKELKGSEGLLVWYPGGSMHSHVAVQAVEQTKGTEHPFAVWLQPDAPKVGDVLEPCNAIDPLSHEQLTELAAMLASAVASMNLEDAKDQEQAIKLGIAALHASPYWTGARHLLVLRAVAIAAMLKFSSAAVLGELRHWNGSGPGRAKCVRRTTPLDEKERFNKLSRDQVYERAFKLHISLLSPRMGTAYLDYKTKGWSGSYGGKNWANCTKSTIDLFNGASEFIKKPSLETWQAVMSAWNLTVNTFHNTGKFLNKFISSHTMDTLAKVPVYGLAGAFVGHVTVRDEDFPLHRNPARIAEELKVIIPKVEKKVVVFVPVETSKGSYSFEARWRWKSPSVIYLQIKLPVVFGKDYGTALDLNIPGLKLRAKLKEIQHTGVSLAGTSTPYCTGKVVLNGGQWMLITDNNLWVPLPAAKMEGTVKAITDNNQSSTEIGEIED